MNKFRCITLCGNVHQNLYFKSQHLQLTLLFSTSSHFSSIHQTITTNPSSSSTSPSLLANYLVKNLGFSKPQSLATFSLFSKRRQLAQNSTFKDTHLLQNANNVVNFFSQLGFQQHHIRNLIIIEPRLLASSIDKTLKPKINLLFDLGFSPNDLILTISRNPFLLHQNLGLAIPTLRVVLGSDDNVVRILKRFNGYYLSYVTKYLVHNFEFLQNSYGIDEGKLRRFVICDPKSLLVSTDVLRENLIWVEEKLGIPRDSPMLLRGLKLIRYSQKCIEEKYRTFRSFGWTESNVVALVRRNPMCLTSSQASIRERLEFLMNEVGYEPSYLALQPSLFTYSVKKRLLPRHRVLEVLKEKGLIRVDYFLVTAASFTEPLFLKKFVVPFKEVHQVYAQLTGSIVEPLPVGKQEG